MLGHVANPLPGVPLVESPFFADHFSPDGAHAGLFSIAQVLREKGYAVFDFPDPDFDAVAERIKRDLHPQYDWAKWQALGHGMRVQDAWSYHDDVRRIATNQMVIDLLSQLYGRAAFPFQTLNFPVGTQQHYHTDSIHFSSIPERFMAGVWVALEDIHVDAGPLIYYPGSHKWPVYVNEHIGHVFDPEKTSQAVFEPLWERLVELSGIQPERLLVKKGQALVWAANLLHGGDAHRDRDRTRWTQVTHYYFEGCSYYTPMASDPAKGSIAFREPTSIATGVRHVNMYCGEEVDPAFIRSVLPRAREVPVLPEGFDAAAYLAANPDVAEAHGQAEEHYLLHGYREGRPLRPK